MNEWSNRRSLSECAFDLLGCHKEQHESRGYNINSPLESGPRCHVVKIIRFCCRLEFGGFQSFAAFCLNNRLKKILHISCLSELHGHQSVNVLLSCDSDDTSL